MERTLISLLMALEVFFGAAAGCGVAYGMCRLIVAAVVGG